ncbi:TonB-dependent receptor [Luteimonas yindakuii]|uniref:TonB-dependent receptor n=1 Tax=Luteimonas yindakuii TaxID=2565782 RepID=UPI001107800E|nr:TonB-dependent receptor [Luteimonas yindakuii]QCO68454.2 TonB-dependent receptor [Luteimonas yindakuii]
MRRGTLACVLVAWPVAAAHAAPPIPPAAADRAIAPTAVQLDRVLVTARRRPEPLHDVPQAITAISGDELESRGATDIAALDMVTPNLTIHPARAFNGSVTAHIRGIGQFDPIWGAEPGVGIYIDDVHLARPQGALLDVLDVERVEVLRGPQGTLYGRNTIGGAIRLVTREPSPAFGGKVMLTAGDHGRRDGRLALDLPLADTVRTRIALAGYDRDGYGRNLFNGAETSARDAAVARGSALWTPRDDVEVRLSWDRYRDRSGAPGGRRLAVPPPRVDPDQIPLDPGRHDVRSGAPERLDLDSEGASLAIDWALHAQWRLRSISAWRHGDSRAVLDMDSLPRTIFTLRRDFDERQRSQEFQLHGGGADWHLVAGLHLFDGTEAGSGRTVFQPGVFYGARGSIRTRSAAVYASIVRDLAPAWQLDAGLRHTVERKTATAYNGYYPDDQATVPFQLSADFTDRATFNAPTPRLALSWRASERTTLYAQASRGFKAGSYNVRAEATRFPGSVRPIDAETVNAYEAGIKAAWLDGRLDMGAVLFHNDYRDIQLAVLIPVGESSFPDYRNAGRGTTRGAEFEWQARIHPWLRWSGHLGYLHARYDEYIDGGTDVADGRHFPNAPRWTAGTSLVANVPLRNAGWLLGRIDGRYQSETRPTTDLDPRLRQGGYALWNASLAWTSPQQRWELALRVDNLADTGYRTTGFAYPNGVVIGYYGPPRTCSMTLAYSFQ